MIQLERKVGILTWTEGIFRTRVEGCVNRTNFDFEISLWTTYYEFPQEIRPARCWHLKHNRERLVLRIENLTEHCALPRTVLSINQAACSYQDLVRGNIVFLLPSSSDWYRREALASVSVFVFACFALYIVHLLFFSILSKFCVNSQSFIS